MWKKNTNDKILVAGNISFNMILDKDIAQKIFLMQQIF